MNTVTPIRTYAIRPQQTFRAFIEVSDVLECAQANDWEILFVEETTNFDKTGSWMFGRIHCVLAPAEDIEELLAGVRATIDANHWRSYKAAYGPDTMDGDDWQVLDDAVIDGATLVEWIAA